MGTAFFFLRLPGVQKKQVALGISNAQLLFIKEVDKCKLACYSRVTDVNQGGVVMEKTQTLNHSEWQIMECLWEKPHTLMELVAVLEKSVGWSKSTVATMVRRMEEKGIISYVENGRTKVFSPVLSREDVAVRETEHLLQRVYNGSIGMLVNAMAQSNTLTKADIDELYEILKKAEEEAK